MLAAEGFKALRFAQLWAAGGITTFESCIPSAGAFAWYKWFRAGSTLLSIAGCWWGPTRPKQLSSRIDSSVVHTRFQLYQANLWLLKRPFTRHYSLVSLVVWLIMMAAFSLKKCWTKTGEKYHFSLKNASHLNYLMILVFYLAGLPLACEVLCFQVKKIRKWDR